MIPVEFLKNIRIEDDAMMPYINPMAELWYDIGIEFDSNNPIMQTLILNIGNFSLRMVEDEMTMILFDYRWSELILS